MNKRIKYTLSSLLGIFMLLGVIGIPVILNHSHSPSFSEETQQEEVSLCEEATLCCGEKEPIKEILSNSNCECSLLASCCCCFLDVRLVSFTFDSPIYSALTIPTFVKAYACDLGTNETTHYTALLTTNNLRLPPIKPYSQRLSLFQVFRI